MKTATRTARKPREGSLIQTVSQLEKGQSHSLVRRVDTDQLDEKTLGLIRRNMNNSMTKTIGRIREEEPKKRYEIETGTLVSFQNRIYNVLIVSRIA